MRIDFPTAFLIHRASASRTGCASRLIVNWSKSKKTSPRLALSSNANEDGAREDGLSTDALGEDGASSGARVVSSVERCSSGIVTMPSGLIVSTGAALLPLVVAPVSPDDDATFFAQPHAFTSSM